MGRDFLTRSRLPPTWIWSSFSFRLRRIFLLFLYGLRRVSPLVLSSSVICSRFWVVSFKVSLNFRGFITVLLCFWLDLTVRRVLGSPTALRRSCLFFSLDCFGHHFPKFSRVPFLIFSNVLEVAGD